MINNIKESALIKKLLNMSHRDNASGIIAKTILTNIFQIEKLNSTDIADLAFTTQSTISKFVNNLGYESFSEFKSNLLKYRQLIQYSSNDNSVKNSNLIAANIEFLKNVAALDLNEVIELIKSSKKIILNSSGGASRTHNEFVIQLQRMGYNILAPVSFSDRYHQSVISDKDTLVILISRSGETAETLIPTLLSLNKGLKVVYISAKEIPDLDKAHLKINLQKYCSTKIDALSFNLHLALIYTLLLNSI
ncbi:MurR/RpiR family transcriptional regulator [Mycoplasmopsis columboralis]|nr:MurR/RpiR family transcriptional regulator [Mycoplasmopsis columboralis]